MRIVVRANNDHIRVDVSPVMCSVVCANNDRIRVDVSPDGCVKLSRSP